jgi:hypothetical protein
MFLFFLSLMIQAIIEREVRLRMKERGIKTLPIYPNFEMHIILQLQKSSIPLNVFFHTK